jgi:hypothetical protein
MHFFILADTSRSQTLIQLFQYFLSNANLSLAECVILSPFMVKKDVCHTMSISLNVFQMFSSLSLTDCALLPSTL